MINLVSEKKGKSKKRSTSPFTRRKNIPITREEKELSFRASSSKEYETMYHKAFPKSLRAESSIRSIWNKRKSWKAEMERDIPGEPKKRGRKPVRKIEIDQEAHFSKEYGQEGKKWSRLSERVKDMAVSSVTFGEFVHKYHREFPGTIRSAGNLRSIYSRRNSFRQQVKNQARKIPAAPAENIRVSRDINEILAEILKLQEATLKVNKEMGRLILEISKKQG